MDSWEIDWAEQNRPLPLEAVSDRIVAHALEDMFVHARLKDEVDPVAVWSVGRLEDALIPTIDVPQNRIWLDPKPIPVEPLWAHLDVQRGMSSLGPSSEGW